MRKLMTLLTLLVVATMTSCKKEYSQEQKCGKVVFVTEFTATVRLETGDTTVCRCGRKGGDTVCFPRR